MATKQLHVPLDEKLMKTLKMEAKKRGMMLYALVSDLLNQALRLAK